MHDYLTDDQAALLWLVTTVATDPDQRNLFLSDPVAYLDRTELTAEAKAAILSGNARQVADLAGVPHIKPIRGSA